MAITSDKLLENLENPYFPALKRFGIDLDRLAAAFDEELKASEPKFLKLKKSEYDPVKTRKALPAGFTLLVETGAEILLRVDLPLIGIRQTARIDGQKVMGLYPRESLEDKTRKPVMVMEDVPLPADHPLAAAAAALKEKRAKEKKSGNGGT